MTLPDSLYPEHFFLPCCPGIPIVPFHSFCPQYLEPGMAEVWGCGGLGRRLEVGGGQAGAEGRQAKGWQLRQVSAPSSFTLNSGAEVEAAPTSSALGSTSTHRWGGGSEQMVPQSSGGLCPLQCERRLGIPQVWLGQPLGRGCLGCLHALPSSLHPPAE